MSYELLRSIERGMIFEERSLADPRQPEHRQERKNFSALREIDHAYQARLAVCIGDRELRISSALSGASRDMDSSSATTTTLRSSRISSDQRGRLREASRSEGCRTRGGDCTVQLGGCGAEEGRG